MTVWHGEAQKQDGGFDQREPSMGTCAGRSILVNQGLQPSHGPSPVTGHSWAGPQGQEGLVGRGLAVHLLQVRLPPWIGTTKPMSRCKC